MQNGIYRAKRQDNGEWVEGYLYVLGKGSRYEETYILESLDERETIYDVWKGANLVTPETVGKFTGIHDVNNKNIFEGDIVRAMMDFGPAGFIENTVPIYWHNSNDAWKFCYFDISTIEVIGNIYDNPELLGNKED